MGKFKIKTDRETYSQVESLLLESGFTIQVPTGKDWVIGELKDVISSYSDWNGNPPGWFYAIKEITLPELSDLVVLKRNDVEDATHEDMGCKYYTASNGNLYGFMNGKWLQFTGGKSPTFTRTSKSETMKEYLVKTKEGEYHYINDSHDICPAYVEKIEIPTGTQFAVLDGENEVAFYDGMGLEKNHFIPSAIIWQRAAHPEELPFIDDEPKSLNDQYAEIEQVRQHSHYFIDVSDVDQVDFYEIALRYNVTDPCIQHILKKCLAVGQRGQKDFHHDLKDIYDTAKRMMAVHGLDS